MGRRLARASAGPGRRPVARELSAPAARPRAGEIRTGRRLGPTRTEVGPQVDHDSDDQTTIPRMSRVAFVMQFESFLVDPLGTGADFTNIEEAIEKAKPGAVIRLAAAEFTISGKLLIDKGNDSLASSSLVNLENYRVNISSCSYPRD